MPGLRATATLLLIGTLAAGCRSRTQRAPVTQETTSGPILSSPPPDCPQPPYCGGAQCQIWDRGGCSVWGPCTPCPPDCRTIPDLCPWCSHCDLDTGACVGNCSYACECQPDGSCSSTCTGGSICTVEGCCSDSVYTGTDGRRHCCRWPYIVCGNTCVDEDHDHCSQFCAQCYPCQWCNAPHDRGEYGSCYPLLTCLPSDCRTCTAAGCVSACAPGQSCCNGTCCASGQCCNGTCCPSGQSCCNGTCRDLQTDPLNCNACGTQCAGGCCVNGTCTTRCGTTCCSAGQSCCAGTCRTGCCLGMISCGGVCNYCPNGTCDSSCCRAPQICVFPDGTIYGGADACTRCDARFDPRCCYCGPPQSFDCVPNQGQCALPCVYYGF